MMHVLLWIAVTLCTIVSNCCLYI